MHARLPGVERLRRTGIQHHRLLVRMRFAGRVNVTKQPAINRRLPHDRAVQRRVRAFAVVQIAVQKRQQRPVRERLNGIGGDRTGRHVPIGKRPPGHGHPLAAKLDRRSLPLAAPAE